jgi:poly(U)-specific endoribonuclease
MLRLYDNYIPEVSSNEVVTDQERQEENAFLDAVFATPVFQQTRQFLISKKFLTEANFRTEFYRIWFGLYSRSSGRVGSSGFEHVFLGELNNGVSGFHNWVYFNNEEGNGNMNYHGYLDYKSFGNKGSLIAHNFDWRRGQKPISSMFVGTSPELELSVFTLCWYARPNAKCTIQFNGTKFYVQTYDITYSSQKYVASSYADISI